MSRNDVSLDKIRWASILKCASMGLEKLHLQKSFESLLNISSFFAACLSTQVLIDQKND